MTMLQRQVVSRRPIDWHHGAIACLCLVGMVAIGCACTRGVAERLPSVVVIVIDTLRADHLGCYGYERPVSPNLDRFAESGIVFENAIAQSSWTAPSIASLFTATYPISHGVNTFLAELHEDARTLAEVFREGGYKTAGFSANFAHVTGRKGFDQGFETFVELNRRAAEPGDSLLVGMDAAAAGTVTDAALTWLEEPRQRPFFLYVHYMDPHSSYDPPEEVSARFVRPYEGVVDGSTEQIKQIAKGELQLDDSGLQRLLDLYDSEVAYVDSEVGRLLRELGADKGGEDVIVVVVSDHGEEFLDHGGLFHGLTLYREVVRVPLLMMLPEEPSMRGVRIQALVELVDVAPTLLELVGIGSFEGAQGTSFAGLLGGKGLSTAEALAHSALYDDPLVDAELREKLHRLKVTTDRWAYIRGRESSRELYDLIADPGETRDLAMDRQDVADRLEQHWLDVRRAIGRNGGHRGSEALDEEMRERLRALGYID